MIRIERVKAVSASDCGRVRAASASEENEPEKIPAISYGVGGAAEEFPELLAHPAKVSRKKTTVQKETAIRFCSVTDRPSSFSLHDLWLRKNMCEEKEKCEKAETVFRFPLSRCA